MPKLLFARPPVDAVEERKIRKLAGARHAPADWIRRARMIALSWDGMRVPALAAAVGCSQKAVRERLARFAAGLDGLGDRPGAGRKPRLGQAQRSRLIALARSTPPGRGVRDDAGELAAADPDGPAVWTLHALTAAARAAGIDIARSQVRRILRAEGVRWHRPRSWTTSADPEFAPKGPGSSSSTRPPGADHGHRRRRARPGAAAHLRPAGGLEPGRAPGEGAADLQPGTGEDLDLRRCADWRRAGHHALRALAQQRALAGVSWPGWSRPTRPGPLR
jgi:transposase